MSLARIAIASPFERVSVPEKQRSMYSRKHGRKCWWEKRKIKSQGLVSVFNHDQIHKKHKTPAMEESKYSQTSQQSNRHMSPGAPSHEHTDILLPQQGQ